MKDIVEGFLLVSDYLRINKSSKTLGCRHLLWVPQWGTWWVTTLGKQHSGFLQDSSTGAAPAEERWQKVDVDHTWVYTNVKHAFCQQRKSTGSICLTSCYTWETSQIGSRGYKSHNQSLQHLSHFHLILPTPQWPCQHSLQWLQCCCTNTQWLQLNPTNTSDFKSAPPTSTSVTSAQPGPTPTSVILIQYPFKHLADFNPALWTPTSITALSPNVYLSDFWLQ